MNGHKAHNVMLIDDSETDLFVNRCMIQIHNSTSTINSFNNPSKALQFLRGLDCNSADLKKELPEFIFLDINMPLMDAFGFLSEFEELSENIKDYTKIVLLTSSMNPRDLQRAHSNKYVKDYIEKPISPDVLGRLFD
jgi:CheY-like chemotaxis protein